MNSVDIIGNLGRDPEVRETRAGRLAVLSVATTETWKDKSGQRQERPQWHRVVIYNDGLVDNVSRYLRKGSKARIRGSLEYRSYDKDGEQRQVAEIVLRHRGEVEFLDPPSSNGKQQQQPPRQTASAYGPVVTPAFDEVPF